MTKNNQTHQKYLGLVENNSDSKGVGLFIFKGAINAIRPYEKVLLPDIKYAEAVAKGATSISFKFIPYNVTIFIKGKQYLFISYDSIPEDKWKCSGRCTCNGGQGECNIDETCLSVNGECF